MGASVIFTHCLLKNMFCLAFLLCAYKIFFLTLHPEIIVYNNDVYNEKSFV